MAGSTFQVLKPMTVKEISAKAQDFDFNPFIALKYWLRTADTLLREVCSSPGSDNLNHMLTPCRPRSTSRKRTTNKLIFSSCDMLV